MGNNNLVVKNRIYSGVDLCKLISAVLVVLIHINETGTNLLLNTITSCISTIAVPFFFIVSGFFFANGLEKTNNKQKYFLFYEKKLIILYLFWQIINLPLNILIYVEKYPHAGVIKYVFLLCRTIFLCGNGVTWYILAMAEAAVVLYLINKFRLNKTLIALIIVGFLLLVGYDCFYELLEGTVYNYVNKGFYVIFSWSNNFIMKAIPYMGIGYIIYNTQVENYNKKVFYKIGMAVSLIISAVVYYLKQVTNIYILEHSNIYLFFVPITTVFFFLVSINLKLKMSKQLSLKCRELSSTIYFLHTYIIYYFLDLTLGVNGNFAIKLLITLAICFVAYIIVSKINNRFLKFIFNIK